MQPINITAGQANTTSISISAGRQNGANTTTAMASVETRLKRIEDDLRTLKDVFSWLFRESEND